MNMKMHLLKAVVGGAAGVLAMAGIAAASNVAVGVDVSTPNARVQIGTPAPQPRAVVVERETVIIKEKDNGKHKGHHKKHKKGKKHKD